MRSGVLYGLALLALTVLRATTAEGSCSEAGARVVRGRLLRCESARAHLQASGADETLKTLLATRPSEHHERLRQIFADSERGTVAVVQVTSLIPLRPASPWSPLETGELGDRIPLSEKVRYWWNTPGTACAASLAAERVELLVRKPCCDTVPATDGCLVDMDHAEPLPPELRDRVAKKRSGRDPSADAEPQAK